jgi:exosome complex exonuclease RRP6
MWLQRDFGVYVVNLFDTGQAARVFGLLSLFSPHHILPLHFTIQLLHKTV